MSGSHRSVLLGLLFCAVAGVSRAQEPADAPVSDKTYPQIVRISYVEGDVRLSQGSAGEKATGASWQAAAANVPLVADDTIATGKGRAVVEFEDASTLYLADNSVLTFKRLNAKAGAPETEMTLLSGTATLALLPMSAGDKYMLHTPIGDVAVRYPHRELFRVTSYLDSTAITPMTPTTVVDQFGANSGVKPGDTMFYAPGRPQPMRGTVKDAKVFADWDHWVSEKYVADETAMRSAMKDAGLSEPVPGLAEMAKAGTFFDCAPYGRCWEPRGGWGADAPQAAAGMSAAAPAKAAPQFSAAPVAYGTGVDDDLFYDDFFPCLPHHFALWQRLGNVNLAAMETGNDDDWLDFESARFGYRWAACHVGSWTRYHRHYVWVAGHKRHHHYPVHWVKSGGHLAAVPIHPKDVPGKPPLNLKNGVYVERGSKDGGFQHVAWNPKDPVKLVDGTPKQYARASYPVLHRADPPRVMSQRFASAGDSRKSPTMLTFDHKSQGFLLAHEERDGNKTRTVEEHFSNRSGSIASSAREGGMAGSSGRGSTWSGGGAGGSSSAAGSSMHNASSSFAGSSAATSHVSAPSMPSMSSSAPSAPSVSMSAPSGGGASAGASRH